MVRSISLADATVYLTVNDNLYSQLMIIYCHSEHKALVWSLHGVGVTRGKDRIVELTKAKSGSNITEL